MSFVRGQDVEKNDSTSSYSQEQHTHTHTLKHMFWVSLLLLSETYRLLNNLRFLYSSAISYHMTPLLHCYLLAQVKVTECEVVGTGFSLKHMLTCALQWLLFFFCLFLFLVRCFYF